MKQLSQALFILFVSTFAMDYLSCKTITCGSTGTSTSGSCVTVTSTTVTLNPCPSESYCINLEQFQSDESFSSSTCTPSGEITPTTCPTTHTGQFDTYLGYCCQNEDCSSGSCDTKSNECIGIATGLACTSSEECESGLFCSNGDSGTCISTFSEGEVCTDDYQCDIGFGCYYGYCYKYWSLDAGNKTTDAKFCKSGNIKDYKCDSLDIYIDSTIIEHPWSCKIGDTCTYKWTMSGSVHDKTECECDGKGSDTGYCPIRDYPTITGFSDDFFEKFQYSDSDCAGDYAHITDLSDDIGVLYACNSIDSDGYDYFNSMQNIINTWSLYSSGQIDDCAKKMGLFNPGDDIDTWDSAEFLTISAIFILFS